MFLFLASCCRLWTPIDGEFDDYIVNPKPSGYQVISFHIIQLESRKYFHCDWSICPYSFHSSCCITIVVIAVAAIITTHCCKPPPVSSVCTTTAATIITTLPSNSSCSCRHHHHYQYYNIYHHHHHVIAIASAMFFFFFINKFLKVQSCTTQVHRKHTIENTQLDEYNFMKSNVTLSLVMSKKVPLIP